MAKEKTSSTASYVDTGLSFGDIARLNAELADAAAYNATNDPYFTGPGLATHELDLIGTEVRGKPVLPLGENVPGTVNWQIDAGLAQDVSDGVITYAFFDHQHALGLNNQPGSFGEGPGYTPFSEAQKEAARLAVGNWDDLIAPTIVEVEPGPGASSWGKNEADIWLANTYTGPAQAWAYFPGYGNQYTRVAGDVWIADPRVNPSNLQFDPGFYGLQTLNHELGHSLGLNHPGNYNFSDDNDGDGLPDPITYEGDAFYFQDSHQYTIMSYFDSYETGGQNVDWSVMRFVYPSTPMIHDIAVAQNKYGADMTTRTGDSTYGFNATADVTNEAMRFEDGEMFTIFTIWDAAGNDTLDLSGYETNSIIDLRPGAHSSAGGWGAYDASLIGEDPTLAQINANNAAAGLGNRSATLFDVYFEGVEGSNEGLSWKEITGTGDLLLMEDNIGIAYGAIIENAIGGGGDDRINGNEANNELTGNGGSDTFIFVDDGSTDTVMDFESGSDVIDLTELVGVDSSDVAFESASDSLFVNTDDDAAYEMTIVVKGDDVNLAGTDILFGA